MVCVCVCVGCPLTVLVTDNKDRKSTGQTELPDKGKRNHDATSSLSMAAAEAETLKFNLMQTICSLLLLTSTVVQLCSHSVSTSTYWVWFCDDDDCVSQLVSLVSL